MSKVGPPSITAGASVYDRTEVDGKAIYVPRGVSFDPKRSSSLRNAWREKYDDRKGKCYYVSLADRTKKVWALPPVAERRRSVVIGESSVAPSESVSVVGSDADIGTPASLSFDLRSNKSAVNEQVREAVDPLLEAESATRAGVECDEQGDFFRLCHIPQRRTARLASSHAARERHRSPFAGRAALH